MGDCILSLLVQSGGPQPSLDLKQWRTWKEAEKAE